MSFFKRLKINGLSEISTTQILYEPLKDYKCKQVFIPHKKPKNAELTDEQKAENKAVSSERIKVEHSIGGLKRYRILSERLRVHDFGIYDDILCVCAGLWNFYLEHN